MTDAFVTHQFKVGNKSILDRPNFMVPSNFIQNLISFFSAFKGNSFFLNLKISIKFFDPK